VEIGRKKASHWPPRARNVKARFVAPISVICGPGSDCHAIGAEDAEAYGFVPSFVLIAEMWFGIG
jgi:hypothetical protein